MRATLDHFVERPDRQLIVRIHPHEVKPGNRQPVLPWLRERYPDMPKNVKVIAHDHPYNTYALMGLCQAVLIYGTKTGVELAPLGMPIIVAGDAWMRSKGITTDVTTGTTTSTCWSGCRRSRSSTPTPPSAPAATPTTTSSGG